MSSSFYFATLHVCVYLNTLSVFEDKFSKRINSFFVVVGVFLLPMMSFQVMCMCVFHC